MELRLDHIGIKEGLSHSSVNCIVEDELGRKWFGTQNGLNRYDGIEIKQYKNIKNDKASLPGNGIADMFIDKSNKGLMWISTNAGFCCLDFLTETITRYEMFDCMNNSEMSSYTRAITPDKQEENILWLGSYNGLLKFKKDTGTFERILLTSRELKSKNNVTAIYDDNKDNLWIGSLGGGVFVFRKRDKSALLIENTEDLKILSMKRSQEYDLLVGTERKGLYKLNMKDNSIRLYENQALQSKLKETSIKCIDEDSKGNLWLGTQEEGLFIFNQGSKSTANFTHDRFNSSSLQSNYVKVLALDDQDRAWIGTLTGGVSVYDPSKYRFKHIQSIPSDENSILSNIIRGFIEDKDGNLWIATENGGVTKCNNQKEVVKHYYYIQDEEDTINSNLIRGMYLDNNNTVWVFTFSGICYYDHEIDNFVRYKLPNEANIDIDNKDLRFCYTDKKSRFWIGSEQGLVLFDQNTNIYDYYHADAKESRRIASNMTKFIFEEWSGRIVISTMGGNSIIDRDNDITTNYYRSQSESKSCYDCFIFCMHENQKDIWIGTFEGLFRKHKSTNEIKRYGKLDGLPNHVIYGILEDAQGRLWISTNNGLSCFNLENNKFINYSTSDGLQSTEFNNSAYLKKKDGEMLFGGINGFNRFYPEEIKIDRSSVPLIFKKFMISNEKLPKTQEVYTNGLLYIPYYANQFSFEFTALEFSHPKKIHYRCILEGYDVDWVNLERERVKSYQNVPNGEYVFRVKSTNKDNIWINNEISIAVRVEQPPWQQALKPKVADFKDNQVLKNYLEEMKLSNKRLYQISKDLVNFNKELSASVYTDALTGLYNRAGYIKYLEKFSSEEFLPLCLIMIDVDSLKLINDNLGHEAGDKLLVRVGDILNDYKIGERTIIARIGGDEFAILIPNCNSNQMKIVDQRMIELTQEFSNPKKDSFFSISYGYANTLETSVEGLYSLADDRMYRFKRENGVLSRENTLKYISIQKEKLNEF